MSTAAMYRDIEKLEIGDKVYLTNFRETLTYQVSEIKIIAPNDYGYNPHLCHHNLGKKLSIMMIETIEQWYI